MRKQHVKPTELLRDFLTGENGETRANIMLVYRKGDPRLRNTQLTKQERRRLNRWAKGYERFGELMDFINLLRAGKHPAFMVA